MTLIGKDDSLYGINGNTERSFSSRLSLSRKELANRVGCSEATLTLDFRL
jgi:hypothetical protein